jgi:8-oxo-dGTP pyrophosphatase MutT (NUDIX family)
MPDPSTSTVPLPFGMPLVRQRLAGRVPRRALGDAPLTQQPLPGSAQSTRRAAVAAILREADAGPEILFIRRAEHPQDPWSGHMAFPGGREEPGDTDLLETAVRETREEVSLDLASSARLLGRLDEVPVTLRGRRTGMTVAPFVFELTRDVELAYNYEVAEIYWAPLEPLFRGQRATKFHWKLGDETVELPGYDVEGRVVWGLTHRMLDALFTLLR